MRETEPYQHEVTEKVESGWRIEGETTDRVTLVKRNFGGLMAHVVIAVLTMWWTMGVANLLYGFYKYVADSERTVVWKAAADTVEPDVVS